MASNAAEEFNETSIKLEDNFIDDITGLKNRIAQLTLDNEHYKQEIHTLEVKLHISTGIEKELQETNESLENVIAEQEVQLKQKIQIIEEKCAKERMELRSRLNDVENELMQKSADNRELQKKLREANQKLVSITVVEPVTEISQSEDTSALKDQVEELLQKLSEEADTRENLEETIKGMKNEICELQDILKITKEQLSEKNAALEITRDELTECRIERDALKVTPASDTCKGNSLFAEVEDRRRKMFENMTIMKQNYYELKRALHTKDAEIRALKAEQAALVNKWKNDSDDTLQQNANLMDKYKERISELEIKLKDKQHKINQLESQIEPKDDAYCFFQSTLNAKKKEVKELETQLENVSIQALLEEEIKHKIQRQLRYWRNKAMASEAQIAAVKSSLETNSPVEKIRILKIFQRDCEVKDSSSEEPLDITEKAPEVKDETIITLEQLITVPKLNVFDSLNYTKGDASIMIDKDLSDFEEHNRSIEVIFEKDTMTTNKIPACSSAKESQRIQTKTLEFTDEKENKSPTLASSNESTEKGKKALRFAEDTIDPQSRKPSRRITPNYPIIYVPSEPPSK